MGTTGEKPLRSHPGAATERWGIENVTDRRPGRIRRLALAALPALSLLLAARFFRSHLGRLWPVLALGFSGIAFLAAVVPTPRFAWGYLSIIICFPLLACQETVMAYAGKFSGALKSEALIFALSAVLVASPLAGASVLFRTMSEKRLEAAYEKGTLPREEVNLLLLPPLIPRITYDDERNLALPHVGASDGEDPLPDERRSMFYPLVP